MAITPALLKVPYMKNVCTKWVFGVSQSNGVIGDQDSAMSRPNQDSKLQDQGQDPELQDWHYARLLRQSRATNHVALLFKPGRRLYVRW